MLSFECPPSGKCKFVKLTVLDHLDVFNPKGRTRFVIRVCRCEDAEPPHRFAKKEASRRRIEMQVDQCADLMAERRTAAVPGLDGRDQF